MGPGEEEAQRLHDRRMERLDREAAELAALKKDRDEWKAAALKEREYSLGVEKNRDSIVLQVDAMRPVVEAAIRACQQAGSDESAALRNAVGRYEERMERPRMEKPKAEFFCNKCGYVGPVQYPHYRFRDPETTEFCTYYAVEVGQSEKRYCVRCQKNPVSEDGRTCVACIAEQWPQSAKAKDTSTLIKCEYCGKIGTDVVPTCHECYMTI